MSPSLPKGGNWIKGIRRTEAEAIVAARCNGYAGPQTHWRRSGIARATAERLAEADALSGMGLGRRDALWQVRTICAPSPLPLFDDPLDGEVIDEPGVVLPPMQLGEEVVEDYVSTRLLRAHPIKLLRPAMPGLTRADALREAPLRRTAACGLVITRQRPGTASGVIFLTLEDETGVANVVVWAQVFERHRRAVRGGRLLRVTGMLQRQGIVTHVIAQDIEDLSFRLRDLGHPMGRAIGGMAARADNVPCEMHPRAQARRLFLQPRCHQRRARRSLGPALKIKRADQRCG